MHVAVLVDHTRLATLLRLRPGASGRLNLTTILPHQARMRVELFIVSGRTRKPLHTFDVRRPDTDAPRPMIVLSGHVRGEFNANLRINGEKVATFSKRIALERRLAPVLWPIALLVLAGATYGGFQLWGRHASEAQQHPGSDAQSERSSVETELPESDPTVDGNRADTAKPEVDAAEPRGDDTPVATPAGATFEDVTIYFDPDSAELTAEARARLDELATRIGDAASELTVSGHTAVFPTARWRSELSAARAQAVAAYLQARLPQTRVDLVARGGQDPVSLELDQQWQNRRVVISRPTRSTPR